MLECILIRAASFRPPFITGAQAMTAKTYGTLLIVGFALFIAATGAAADENTAARDRVRAIEVRGKMCGWMSKTIQHETPQRRAAIDEARRKQLMRLSLLEQNCLAGDMPLVVDGEIVQPSDTPTADTTDEGASHSD